MLKVKALYMNFLNFITSGASRKFLSYLVFNFGLQENKKSSNQELNSDLGISNN